MERAEDDVPGFGRCDGCFDRLQVAHFADEDYVRVLPQRAAQRLGEARHIDADFALIDRRFLAVVVELDRVFDRDDVVIDRLVDVVDHAGQRRALAGPGRPGHQEQSARSHAELGADGRRAQLLHRQQLVGNLPQHHADISTLLEHGDAKTGIFAEGKAEVAAADLRQLMLAAVGRDALHQGHRVVRLEDFRLELPHPAVHAEHRRLTGRNVDVAGVLLDAGHQQFVDKDIAHRSIGPPGGGSLGEA